MTIPALSPEEFMTQPVDPEDDTVEEAEQHVDVPIQPGRIWQIPSDPLASIARSIERIEEHLGAGAREAAAFDDRAQLQAEYDELEALHDAKQALIEQVLEICKPSTSKLADKIRAAIEPVIAPPVAPAPQSEIVEQPADDADVFDWRAFAVSEGLPAEDVAGMNRSQIRTALGIEQPAGGES